MRLPGRQGRHLDREDQSKIEALLKTDMTISEIAQRMGCCGSVIARLNTILKIRDYNGRRTSWNINTPEKVHPDDKHGVQ